MMKENKVIEIPKGSKAWHFFKSAVERKREIQRQLRSGKKIAEVKGKDIKFVKPI